MRSAVDYRHEKLAMRHDMAVKVDPEILAVIQASTHVSTTKGNSAHLLKIGTKRRRSKAEMIEFRKMRDEPLEVIAAKDSELAEKQEEINAREEAMNIQAVQIRELQSQLNESKSKLGAAQKSEVLVSQLLEANVIVQSDDGSYALGEQ